MKFFQDEFRNTAAKQHGEAIVCRDASCSLCHRQVVTCPGEGCTEQTGRVRIGVPGCEIFQMHPENLPCSASLGVGPAKRCCTVHVRERDGRRDERSGVSAAATAAGCSGESAGSGPNFVVNWWKSRSKWPS